MREILFRGKRLDNGEWIIGYYAKLPHPSTAFLKDYIVEVKFDEEYVVDDIEYILVDPKTVGQFTGLLDKNGNKIFEGDIIKSKYNTTVIKFGEFHDTKSHEQVGFYQVYWGDDWDDFSNATMDDVKDGEIIGNIHDNGDLYKKIKGEIK
ncbi:MAG TPA: hypothetical protein GYA04_01050 [Acholeplasma sp.]|nr:hypothetical protein [Acholeplasma sp.]